MLRPNLVLLTYPVRASVSYLDHKSNEYPIKWFLTNNFLVYKPNLLIFNKKLVQYRTKIVTKLGSPWLLRLSPILLSTNRQTDGHS